MFDLKFPSVININYRVDGLSSLVTAINHLGEKVMSLAQDLKDLTTAIDTASAEVAKDIADLKNKIKNSLTDAEVADVKAGLTAIEERLKVLGSEDFSEPVV